MKAYTNKLGITCIEPSEGHLLKKNGQTFKKVYLSKNDRAELYEEVKDETIKETDSEKPNGLGGVSIVNGECVLTSPNGSQFKLTVSDDGALITKRI